MMYMYFHPYIDLKVFPHPLKNHLQFVINIKNSQINLTLFCLGVGKSLYNGYKPLSFINESPYDLLQACPLNGNVTQSSEDTQGWSDMSEFFTPAIKSVVDFAKAIPGFCFLSQDDQVTLLKVI